MYIVYIDLVPVTCLTFVLICLCRRYHVSKRRVIPLPVYSVDPETQQQALFKPKQVFFFFMCTNLHERIWQTVQYHGCVVITFK